ncbi:MAG: hypothetical protein JNM94_00460 [Phycisphaerae bacterium]|nr:hypothetical protein [Phycisphaerae bacterium]
MKSTSTARLAGSLAAVVAALPASTALANITINYASSTNYTYLVSKVPDFDQRRATLPNNGNMYCVPTSATNWMAYIANHGYPELQPGPGNWQASSKYGPATLAILFMGLQMNTSATGGTDLDDAVLGAQTQFLNSPYALEFIVIGQNASNSYFPTFDTLANHALLKRLVMPRIGWYQQAGSVLTRNGGHVTSMTRALRSGSNRTIGINDPASDDGDLSSQGTFSREEYPISNQVVVVDGMPRTMSKMVGYGSGWIDGYRAIIPIFGLTTSPNQFVLNYVNFAALGAETPVNLSVDLGTTIHDLQILPDATGAIVLNKVGAAAPVSVLNRVDFATGLIEAAHSQIGDIKALTVGRKGPIYFITGTTLSCKSPVSPTSPPQTVTPPGPPAALVFDDLADQVVVLDTVNKRVMRYPEALLDQAGAPIPPQVFQLPTNLVFNGTPFLAVHPLTGRTWYATSGSDKIFEIVPAAGGGATVNPLLLPAVQSIQSLQFDDLGRIFVCDGSVKGFAPPPPGGGTASPLPPTESPFLGLPTPKFFRIATSRHNYDAATMTLPPQQDIVLPTQTSPPIPDCIADLNGDDIVNGADVALILGAWGTKGFSDADLDQDGVIDGSDLGLLLGSSGACP